MKNIRRTLIALFVMMAFIVTPVYAGETVNNDIQNANENQDRIPREPPQHDVGRGNDAEETVNDVYRGPRNGTRNDRFDDDEDQWDDEEDERNQQDEWEEDTEREQPGQERRY